MQHGHLNCSFAGTPSLNIFCDSKHSRYARYVCLSFYDFACLSLPNNIQTSLWIFIKLGMNIMPLQSPHHLYDFEFPAISTSMVMWWE